MHFIHKHPAITTTAVLLYWSVITKLHYITLHVPYMAVAWFGGTEKLL